MNKNMNELDELLEMLAKDLLPDARVSFTDFMNKPCITVKYSRRKTSVKVENVTNFEIKDAVANILVSVLKLLPKKDRMNVARKAVKHCEHEKGKIYED